MALIIRDRVKETTTTTGTGALTLDGAMTGFRTFASVCSTNDTLYYALQAVDAVGNPSGDWEVGLGTYSGSNTLTRTTILSSSTGSAINLAAGTKQVWIDIAASDYATARNLNSTIVTRAANQAISASTWTAVSWDTEVEDTVGAWVVGTPTRITVPSGFTRVRFTSYVVWANSSTGNRYQRIDKNGSTTLQLDTRGALNESGNTLVTQWFTVTAGDYFEVFVNTSSAINLSGTGFAGPTALQVEWRP